LAIIGLKIKQLLSLYKFWLKRIAQIVRVCKCSVIFTIWMQTDIYRGISSLFFTIFKSFLYNLNVQFNSTIARLLTVSQFCVFICGIPSWRWLKMTETCRSLNVVSNYCVNFYVLLTVHPNIMIVFFTNLIHKFFILIYLLYSSICFEHYCAHLQEDICINTASGIVTVFGWLFITQASLPLGDCSVYRRHSL